MAKIVGAITTSHVPAIGRAIAKNLQADPYWKPFFDGFGPIHQWLAETRPDVVVVFYNDHGLNFFLDKMPTFSVGAAPSYTNADEGWGIPTLPPFAGEQDLSWHVINSLIADEFDLTTCQEMTVDHAFTLPMALPRFRQRCAEGMGNCTVLTQMGTVRTGGDFPPGQSSDMGMVKAWSTSISWQVVMSNSFSTSVLIRCHDRS